MNIKKLLPTLGLIASFILTILCMINTLVYIIKGSTLPWLSTTNLFSPLLIIIIFLAIKFIIVGISRIDSFNILLHLIIIIQAILFLINFIFRVHIVPTKILIVPFVLSALILVILVIWFFILLSYIDKDELVGLPSLQLYAISVLIVLIIGIIPMIMPVYYKTNFQTLNIINLFAIIAPYFFLSMFFLKNLSARHS